MAHYADPEQEADNQLAQEQNRFKSYSKGDAMEPNQHFNSCVTAGAKAEELKALEAAVPNINWGNVWQLVQKYGPVIIGEILKIIQGTPAPAGG